MNSKFYLNITTNRNDSLGSLSFFESSKDIPFEIKRVYYIYNVPEKSKRGFHAHKNLKQLLWCPHGSIEILLDDGKDKSYLMIDSPEKAILVKEGLWHEMIWHAKDSVLCVAASDYYNEDDYIRNYDEFIEYVKKGYWNNQK
jgi:dTDP-4-dehydrorhamnose 3,5-epimerase-like enzyme